MTALITPAELPRWVPGKVLCASDDLGWSGVGLRGYHYAGLDVAVPGMRDFMIVSYQRGATSMERRFDGRWTRTLCRPGDVSLLTRSQQSHWHWTEDIDVCHVYLTEQLVSRVAREVMDRNVAEVRLHDILRTEDPVLTSIAQAIQREAAERAPGNALYVEALGVQLAVHLLRKYASVSAPATHADDGSLSPAQARRLVEYIDEHLADSLSLQALAEVAGLGVWNLSRRFRRTFGSAAHAYVVERRVERAQRLLAHGGLAPKQVAAACGFADQAHMTRVFRQRLGTTPAQLRRHS